MNSEVVEERKKGVAKGAKADEDGEGLDPAFLLPDVDALSFQREQQRMKYLENLVQKRCKDWEYLKVVHSCKNGSPSYWMGCVHLSREDIIRSIDEEAIQRRTESFFYLGVSLGKLFDTYSSVNLVKAGCQLFEELDYHLSNSAMQNMKLLMAPSVGLYDTFDRDLPDANVKDGFRPGIKKWEQNAVYQCLLTPKICFPLDYSEIVVSLCDLLGLVYVKFIDKACSMDPNIFQLVLQLDQRFKVRVLDRLVKELSVRATLLAQEELDSILARKNNKK